MIVVKDIRDILLPSYNYVKDEKKTRIIYFDLFHLNYTFKNCSMLAWSDNTILYECANSRSLFFMRNSYGNLKF